MDNKYLRGASISDPTKKIFDLPDAIPTITGVTDVGTGLAYGANGQAIVSVVATPTTGGPITSFKVTSNPGALTSTGSSPVTISGLSAGTTYTYTAQSANAYATGPTSSSASSAVTATTVPQAPTIGTVTDGGTGTTVSIPFTAGATGGSAITSYSIVSSPATTTQTTSSSPYTFTGLTAGTAYTFTVTATNANGTSTASSASNSVTPVVPSNFFLISQQNVSAVSTVTFSSIPQTYKSLQIRFNVIMGAGNSGGIQFNGDTTNGNYYVHSLYAGGTTVGANGASNNRIITIGYNSGSVATYPNVGIVDILDYTNTSKYKTAKAIFGANKNATGGNSGDIELDSGLWLNTSAITSINFQADTNMLSGTTVSLYGVS